MTILIYLISGYIMCIAATFIIGLYCLSFDWEDGDEKKGAWIVLFSVVWPVLLTVAIVKTIMRAYKIVQK